MGRATRWLRGLLGAGKKPDSGAVAAKPPATEKKRWLFGKSFREKDKRQHEMSKAPMATPSRAPLEEDEQSKRAVAVAAASAAVAEAAVAAARAAAAVVSLTRSGRAMTVAGKREEWAAAVKIQSTFRGYLARRALKALRGLVKLQALVRGNIVRKQAVETLRCMHALVRVQARARASRALRSESCRADAGHLGPSTPEKYELAAARARCLKSDNAGPLKVNSSRSHSSSGRNWLDRWIEEKYADEREAGLKAGNNLAAMDDESAKILEVDSVKHHRHGTKKRTNHHHQSSPSTLASDQNSRSFMTLPDSHSKDSTAHMSVPSPGSVDMCRPLSPLGPATDVSDLLVSPQYYSATSRPGSSRRGHFTPSKSECARSLFGGYSDYPNYMATTESSKAKVRSQSAPKQRLDCEHSGLLRRSSVPSQQQQPPLPSTQRPSSLHAKFTNKAYPGSGRLDRLGMPVSYH